MEIFNTDQDIRRVLMQLINGYYSPQDPELFRDIYNSLLNTKSSDRADTYFILKDFRSYAEAQKRVDAAYRDENVVGKSSHAQHSMQLVSSPPTVPSRSM